MSFQTASSAGGSGMRVLLAGLYRGDGAPVGVRDTTRWGRIPEPGAPRRRDGRPSNRCVFGGGGLPGPARLGPGRQGAPPPAGGRGLAPAPTGSPDFGAGSPPAGAPFGRGRAR